MKFEVEACELKSDHSKKDCLIYLDESLLKMMKNAFYFLLKVRFVHKIFKFWSLLFGHVKNTRLD